MTLAQGICDLLIQDWLSLTTIARQQTQNLRNMSLEVVQGSAMVQMDPLSSSNFSILDRCKFCKTHGVCLIKGTKWSLFISKKA